MAEIKLRRVVETCGGCPAQWDAWDAEGTYYYLRFRYGHGSVSVGENHESTQIREFSYGDDMAGIIDLETFARLAGLDVSEAEHAPRCFDHGYTYCTICDPALPSEQA